MGSGSELFDGNYLLLKAEEASVVDLGSLLFSSNLNNRRFIECQPGLEAREFRQRLVLFASVVAQKLLLASNSSLKKVGDLLEWWLNLLNSNEGFIHLFLNILKGSHI